MNFGVFVWAVRDATKRSSRDPNNMTAEELCALLAKRGYFDDPKNRMAHVEQMFDKKARTEKKIAFDKNFHEGFFISGDVRWHGCVVWDYSQFGKSPQPIGRIREEDGCFRSTVYSDGSVMDFKSLDEAKHWWVDNKIIYKPLQWTDDMLISWASLV